jgi:hypothetical protein
MMASVGKRPRLQRKCSTFITCMCCLVRVKHWYLKYVLLKIIEVFDWLGSLRESQWQSCSLLAPNLTDMFQGVFKRPIISDFKPSRCSYADANSRQYGSEQCCWGFANLVSICRARNVLIRCVSLYTQGSKREAAHTTHPSYTPKLWNGACMSETSPTLLTSMSHDCDGKWSSTDVMTASCDYLCRARSHLVLRRSEKKLDSEPTSNIWSQDCRNCVEGKRQGLVQISKKIHLCYHGLWENRSQIRLFLNISLLNNLVMYQNFQIADTPLSQWIAPQLFYPHHNPYHAEFLKNKVISSLFICLHGNSPSVSSKNSFSYNVSGEASDLIYWHSQITKKLYVYSISKYVCFRNPFFALKYSPTIVVFLHKFFSGTIKTYVLLFCISKLI